MVNKAVYDSRVFRIQLNICGGAFAGKIVNEWKPLTIFVKKLYRRYSTGFQIRLCVKYPYLEPDN